MPLDAPVTRATWPVRSGPGTFGTGEPPRKRTGRPIAAGPSGVVGWKSVVAVAVVVPDLSLDEPGLLHERLAEHVLVGAQDGLDGGLPGGGQVVLDLILALGDGNLVAGPQGPVEDALAIHLDPVGAAQVADLPVPGVLVGQLAVQAGDVRELQADVARLPPADGQDAAPEGDRVAAPHGHEFAHGVRHLEPSQTTGMIRMKEGCRVSIRGL